MQSIQYVGEHLWVQSLGHFLILAAFFSAAYLIIASISFLRDQKNSVSWSKWFKAICIFHAFVVFSIIGLMLFMMSNKWYEYHYVWEHVSDDLPMKYILSAFWEGQEGSFLLWMFWNIVLGFFLLRKKDEFVITNIGILAGVQLILLSMILGVYIGEIRIGSNPFLLLRQTMDIPLFNNAEYVSLIKGNGMNPLLQNYWMLIHPPTLFLGFASVVVPLCYAMSGLFHRKYLDWLKPALPWSLFSASILGLGILMGGAWAYEALSFGGYWAWDPVENMSLVPWLILVAGIHSHLIALHTGYSVKAAFLFYTLSFGMVVYSTYLTRSGVLGDTSVHAFTGLGLGWQLIFFIAATILIPVILYFLHKNKIPFIKKEEEISSREFWMYIGALSLLFSSGLISFTTSIPVYNKLLDFFAGLAGTDLSNWHRSAPVDVVAHHNRFQIWIAVLLGLLMGCTIFLRYVGQKELNFNKSFWKEIALVGSFSAALTLICLSALERINTALTVLIFAAWISFVGSIWYFFKYMRKNPRSFGSLISHSGFGLLILGIVFSGVNRKNLVPDSFFQEDFLFADDPEAAGKHFLLIKNQAKLVNDYLIEYKEDSIYSRFRDYTIAFTKTDSSLQKTSVFYTHPQIQYDNKLTKVAASNPSIKRYLHKDIFTLIAQIPAVHTDAESAQKAEDSLEYEKYDINAGDTSFGKKYYFILKRINSEFHPSSFELQKGDIGFEAEIEMKSLEDSQSVFLRPGIVFRGNTMFRFPAQAENKGVKINLGETVFDAAFSEDSSTHYNDFQLKEGESIQVDNKKISLVGFDREPSSLYLSDKKEDDIVIGAKIKIEWKDQTREVLPIYLIRGQTIIPVPDRMTNPYITLYFTKVDPDKGEMSFRYYENKKFEKIPLEIAENAPRTDYLVMEAIVFPGINLVWLGSLMMIAGLMYGAWIRKQRGPHK
ncbi:MAG: cytochrome c biogenesis protein CcsA [Saprospiraceae bacterium]|nr:cytochrome c biogenesis protein CcsA [Saprospiraceae bacterium]